LGGKPVEHDFWIFFLFLVFGEEATLNEESHGGEMELQVCEEQIGEITLEMGRISRFNFLGRVACCFRGIAGLRDN